MPGAGGGVGHIWVDMGHTRPIWGSDPKNMGHTRPIWGTDPKREDIVDSGGRIGNGG